MTSLNSVYVVGTDHDFQIADGRRAAKDVSAFASFISASCQRFRVGALAEEMSVEVVRQRGQAESVCLHVARSLRLAHRYCDPDTRVREQQAIFQETDLHMEVFYGRLQREQFSDAVRLEHAKRERIWLEELQRLN